MEKLLSPDCINYLESEEDIEKFFKFVLNLKPEESINYVNINNYQQCKNDMVDETENKRMIIQEKKTGKFYLAQINPNEKMNTPEEFEKQKKLDEIISKFDHPSILKYFVFSSINYDKLPHPVLINEYLERSLYDVLKSANDLKEWNMTKKLINIYGIAAGMKYLHSNGILHRNLTASSIIEDENYHPKITNFHNIQQCKDFSKNNDGHLINSKYASPEVVEDYKYSKSSDVFSFAIILYEIITNEIPFSEFQNDLEIRKAIWEGYRPEFNKTIPQCYQNLIELCWSDDPSKRPTFHEIVDLLKNNQEFVTEEVDQNEFKKYIKIIDDHIKPVNEIISIQQKNEIIFLDINDFQRESKIGSGSFSTVFKVKEKSTGKLYAAKIMDVKSGYLHDIENTMFNREIKIMFNLKHPSIIEIKGFSPLNFNLKPRPTIIYELAKGNLRDVLELERRGNSPLEWDSTKKHITLYGIASGMQYMHSLGIIHRDLKPDNILEDDYLFPKISDFGFAKNLNENNKSDSFQSGEEFKGTIAYSPPEMIKSCVFSKPGDVYSYGIMAYEILSGNKLYENMTPYDVMNEIVQGKRPQFNFPISNSYKNLIEKCWADDLNLRPSFGEIVEYLKEKTFDFESIDFDEFNNYVDFINDLNTNVQKEVIFKKVESEIKIKKENFEIKVSPVVHQIDLNEFEKKDKIGSGGFARVYKVIKKSTKEVFAAKIMKNETTDLREKEQINLVRELEIISQIQYESIMKFVGYSLNNFSNKQKPVLISEIHSNGSLAGILDLERHGCGIKGWDSAKKLINIYGIASAMKYLHNKNILHRDLKPDNVLLDEYLYPKLSDFGLSKEYFGKVIENCSDILGTPPYISPEIWKKSDYTKASDVYAFAMIVFEIMTNEEPAKQFRLPETICYHVAFKKYRPKFNVPIPQCYKDLIEKCWSEDPEDRPSFDEIVYILKSNPDFIFNNADLNELINYSEIVGEKYILNNEEKVPEKQKEALELESIQSLSTKQLIKYDVPNVKERISEHTITAFNKVIEHEMKSMSITNYFINLNDYETKELIRKSEINNIIKVIQKNTGNVYSAKVSNIDMTQFTEEEMTRTAREFNKILQLKHPSILQFVGFSPQSFKKEPKPVVITELYPSKSLADILRMDKKNHKITDWDATKKLMNIYGIASAMKCLHSHGIIHRNLKPSNIIVDDSLLPILSDFGICTHLLMMNSMTFQSASKIQGSSVYSAPEVIFSGECTKASDVYSFSMIVYEIMTKEKPVVNVGKVSGFVSNALSNIKRPEFKISTPGCYKNMIEIGWSEDPNERPTFDQIVHELENDPNFITQDIDKNQYFNYIKKLQVNL